MQNAYFDGYLAIFAMRFEVGSLIPRRGAPSAFSQSERDRGRHRPRSGHDAHQATLNSNGTHTLSYTVTAVPGADRTKVRGEEGFSIFSLPDTRVSGSTTYSVPETQIASQFIQIWPVASGTISGIAPNQSFRFTMPIVTFTLNDLYPQSTTYAQVYQGKPSLGKTGTVVLGSSLVVDDSLPTSRVLVVDDLQSVLDSDGKWTMEILTRTPFGIDRLAYVTFDLDLTITVNGTVTTVE